MRASTERNQKSHAQSTHSSTSTQTTSVAPSKTATATVASEPPRIPTAISNVTREKEATETTATVTHQHIPSNTKILNNPETFHTHLAEIDHALNAKDKLAEGKP